MMLGASGHALSVADVLRRGGAQLAAVAGSPRGSTWAVPVISGDDEALELARAGGHLIALGVGANQARERIWASLGDLESSAPPVLGRTATVATDARVGFATVVLEHAHVGPASVLGRAVIVNTAAVVEHDCVVGDGAHVAPGATVLGGCSIGRRAMIGAGARILPGVSVGDDAVVGAGAVVREDVPGGHTVVGVPAGPLVARPAARPRPDTPDSEERSDAHR
ncbi:transferase [Nostocoides sp. HKS02]|nr:transferase [Tetrasphaera sp. HKS02]